jgi:hypothetical protein
MISTTTEQFEIVCDLADSLETLGLLPKDATFEQFEAALEQLRQDGCDVTFTINKGYRRSGCKSTRRVSRTSL